MSAPTLLIRADASIAIGTGHVMRCLALAQAWQDAGGYVVFAMADATPGIEERLRRECVQVVKLDAAPGTADDSGQTARLAARKSVQQVVVDGYGFGADYQRALKAAGFKVLFLDDYGHASHYPSDVVLNQNPYADEGMYAARDAGTRLLLGPSFCLLRREFTPWRMWKREIAPIGRKILVTIGGSDPGNITGMVIKGLQHLSDIEAIVIQAIVVVGAGNPHFADLERDTSQLGNWLNLKRNVTEMPELMAWADVAVAAAGSTCWELCLLQLPMMLIDIAENQKAIAKSVVSRGAAIHLGHANDVTEDAVAREIKRLLESGSERASLSERCSSMVDGRGTERVLKELTRD